VFVKEEYTTHRKNQDDGGPFAHLECPRNIWQIVKHHVRQRWVPIHVWDSIVNDDHDKCGEHEDKKHVDVADKELDKISVEMTGNVPQCARSHNCC